MKYTENSKKKFFFLMTAFAFFSVLSTYGMGGVIFFTRFGKSLINVTHRIHEKIGLYKEHRFLNNRIRFLLDQRSEGVSDISRHETSRLWHDLYKNKKQISKVERFYSYSFQNKGYEYFQRLCFGKEGLKDRRLFLNILKKQREEVSEKINTLNERITPHPHIQKIDDELEQVMQRRLDRLNHFRST